ncbi:urease accessory protein UreF [Sulfoacidibacillus thermotolerans]|uniref:Urease accessory protein UreF n=1 Tax=Sulfoacidibacillus thermotolerans TaxID=1765684 RepID=A0A2U3DCB5_SULT2|nr:urease accessory protein UreF [Sulfoacidibacillus thermotolerans]PWI58885.1 hypothetical protein BM613_02025 [Sulfoacidibacillus thermotolerans]
MKGCILPLLQLADSGFPTGAFSHSFGLETALAEKTVSDVYSLQRWLEDLLRGSFATMEAPGVYFSYYLVTEYMERFSDLPARTEFEQSIALLDYRLTLSKLARESREGSTKIGRQYLRMTLELYPHSHLQLYDAMIRKGICYGNGAIVHGFVCAYLGIDQKLAIATYLYSAVNALVQNAVRATVIGQTEGQKTLASLFPALEDIALDLVKQPPAFFHLANAAIFHEIQGMRHETLYSRLFMS